MKFVSVAVITCLKIGALCQGEMSLSASYQFEIEPEHLVPTTWAGYDLSRETLLQFRGGRGWGPPIGWEIREAESGYEAIAFKYEHNEEKSEFEITSEEKIIIAESGWLELVFSMWVEEILKTRYPKLIDAEGGIIIRVDGSTSQYLAIVGGLGAIRGEAWDPGESTTLDYMAQVGNLIYQGIVRGTLNTFECVSAIELAAKQRPNK